jgi:EmrB/QacA subfamily drug resistance transporter
MRHTTNPWVILVLVCLAQFMVILDATVVNVALPSIQRDLGLSEANLQWIVNAYTLLFGGFLLLGGRAGDLLGRKRLFLAGVVVFTVASLLDGLATSSGMLIGSRALQGLGAAFISPAALSIISTTFAEGKERGKALGIWAAIASGGSAVGLVLGGVLTQAFSWPWIFFINVPVGIAAFVLSLRLIPESTDEHAERSFDVAGAVTATGGLMVLVFGIVKAESYGWGSARTIGAFLVAIILLGAFVVIELRSTAPLVRLSIFRVRSLTAANVVMLLVASGLFAMFFFNSLYIQRVLGYGPLKAGLAFLPFTAGIMVSAGIASQYAAKIGVRVVAGVGMVITTAGLLWLTQIPVHGSYVVDVLAPMLLTSLGMGLVFVVLTLVATTGLDDADQGLASGLFNTSQQIGGALGLAILATLAASRSSGPTQKEALVHGFHWAFAGSAVFVGAALLVLVVLLRRRHVERIAAAADATPALGGV